MAISREPDPTITPTALPMAWVTVLATSLTTALSTALMTVEVALPRAIYWLRGLELGVAWPWRLYL